MQEMEEKQVEEPIRKMTSKEEGIMKKMIREKGSSLQEVEKRFPRVSK